MTDILYPSKSRRFMSEVAGVRRYHRNSGRAVAAARGGVLWVAVCKGCGLHQRRLLTIPAATVRTAANMTRLIKAVGSRERIRPRQAFLAPHFYYP